MIITNRQRAYGQGKTYVKNKRKIPLNFDLSSLDLLCNFVISENRNVRRLQYINLRNLIEMLDMEKYISDQERYKRILFIKKGLEARLERNLQDRIMILKYINGGILDNDIIDISDFKDMSNAEIDWINETVSSAIKYAFIYERVDPMIELWQRFKNADYRSVSEISSEIEAATSELNTLFRKAKVESSTERAFSLTPEVMESVMTDAWQEVTSSYRKLITGMQGFNQLIGGGFENTRVYLLLGITGVGKSMTLVNLAYQLKKYNKGFKPKDPTKRPCVLYVTMEGLFSHSQLI
jgi:cellulose biosynthesis protein BcsQ